MDHLGVALPLSGRGFRGIGIHWSAAWNVREIAWEPRRGSAQADQDLQLQSCIHLTEPRQADAEPVCAGDRSSRPLSNWTRDSRRPSDLRLAK